MHYVKTFRVPDGKGGFTSRGTNLYWPEPKNDLFEYHPDDSIYQSRREDINGTQNPGGETVFTRLWDNAISDIKVYVDGVLKTQGTGSANYAVQDGSGNAGLSNTGTGAVVFVTAPSNATILVFKAPLIAASPATYSVLKAVAVELLNELFAAVAKPLIASL